MQQMSDIRGGSIYRRAKAEMRQKIPNARMIGIILAVDDTNLTVHSGSHTGRPLYMTVSNLPLSIRRKINNYAWRPIGFLPNLDVESANTREETSWQRHAKVKFASQILEKVLEPLVGAREAGFNVRFSRFVRCLSFNIYIVVQWSYIVSGGNLLFDRPHGSVEIVVLKIPDLSSMHRGQR